MVEGADDVERGLGARGRRQAGARIAGCWAETVVEIEFLVTLIVVRSEGPAGPVIEFCSPIGHRGADAGALESWQPQKMTPAALDAAKSIAARIVKALGGRGVFSVELMINGDEVYFADVSAGPPDSAWVTLRSQRLSAFELQARTILGVAVDTMMVSPGAARVIDHGPAALGSRPAAMCSPPRSVCPRATCGCSGRPTPTSRSGAVPTGAWRWPPHPMWPPPATAPERSRHALNMRDSRA